jgi:hypothetical protein
VHARQGLEDEILMLCCGRPVCAVECGSGFLGRYGNSKVEIKGLSPMPPKTSFKRSLVLSMPANHPWSCAGQPLNGTRNGLIKGFIKSLPVRLTC